MTQRTRNIVANILVGVSILLIVAFLAQRLMTAPRPSWHKDLAWLALASVIASELVRGRRRRAMENPD
jgi:hypothetical protein